MTVRTKHRYLWAALVLFLGAQVLVAQHDAQFGPEKHTHNGHPCDIQLVADHGKAPSLPSLPAVVVPVAVARTTILSDHIVPAVRFYRPAIARAPPLSVA